MKNREFQEMLKERTKQFALRVFKFLMTLQRNKPIDVISYQLLRASSSVAANYRAVCRSKSDADFLNKLKTVDEEADECLFWLEFIRDLGINFDKQELSYLLDEANQRTAIFSKSIGTLKAKAIA